MGGPWLGLGGTWAGAPGWLLVLVWGVDRGALVVPFPLTAGLPLVGSPYVAQTTHLVCGRHPPHDAS